MKNGNSNKGKSINNAIRNKIKEELGLPILPTTSVGSLPKPDYIKEARRKKISKKELRKLEDKATEFWVRFQDEIGIDIIVDGEVYRGDMVTFFAENMEGFKMSGLVRSYGNRYYIKPRIVGKIKWKKPITVDRWKFAQSLTKKPVKGMLTGPYTMMDWSFDEYYGSREKVCITFAKELRKEVEALAEAGAKIIQIDEPAISTRPYEFPIAKEALEIMTEGIPVYFITHICYGAFEFVYPQMLKLPVHNFDLEMSNSELDLIELFKKHPFTKDISFGVIDVHTHKVEDVETIKARIRKALEVLDINQVWVDPDCGLKTRTEEEAKQKLQNMVKATEEIRKEIEEIRKKSVESQKQTGEEIR